MQRTDWSQWQRHFQSNRTRPMPDVPPESGIDLPAGRRAAVAASLARFQLGEAGEGRIAQEVSRMHRRSKMRLTLARALRMGAAITMAAMLAVIPAVSAFADDARDFSVANTGTLAITELYVAPSTSRG